MARFVWRKLLMLSRALLPPALAPAATCAHLEALSINSTFWVDGGTNRLYIYYNSSVTYNVARSKCSSIQPVPGATTSGYPVAFNSFDEEVGAGEAARASLVEASTKGSIWG